MENATIVQVGTLVVFSIATVLLLVGTLLVVQKLKNSPTGSDTPLETAVYKAVELFAYRAILVAYRAADKTLDEFKVRLTGLDKKKIADGLYDMIPDEIGGIDVRIIKSIVDREKFSLIVEDVFREMDTFYNKNQVGFDKAVQKFLEDHKPDTSPPPPGFPGF